MTLVRSTLKPLWRGYTNIMLFSMNMGQKLISPHAWRKMKRLLRWVCNRQLFLTISLFLGGIYLIFCEVRMNSLSTRVSVTMEELHAEQSEFMAQLENARNMSGNDSDATSRRVKRSEIKGYPEIVMFNRIPKSGTSGLVDMFKHAGEMNNFSVSPVTEVEQPRLIWKEQDELAKEVYALPQPVLFQRHVHFLEFSPFKRQTPIFISIVRDPFERLLDTCLENNSTTCSNLAGFLPSVPFFCGHNVNCKTTNAWSINRAITNVIKYYSVVGVAEETGKFVEVLQNFIPRYFVNVSNLHMMTTSQNAAQQLAQKLEHFKFTNTSIKMMKQKLKLEYDFYDLIKTRFMDLYSEVVEMH